MGRLTKQGIDYFSLDVQFDDKTELYLIETESTGLAVMITLWQLIYQNEGYYIKHTDDLCLLIKRRINASINDIDACINVMLKRYILDYNRHKKYKILTSRAIQKRYFDAAKRKKEVNVISEFAMVDLKNYGNLIYTDINDKDVDINGKDVGGNATKGKEEGKEEGKGKETTKEKVESVLPIWLDRKTWEDFKNHRKGLKPPMTDNAENLIISKLQKLHDDGNDVKEVLEQSIINGWKGVFEVKHKPELKARNFQQEYNVQSAKAFLERGE